MLSTTSDTDTTVTEVIDLIQQSLCPTLPVQEKDGRDKFRCRKRKKRKKRKRKCRPGEEPGPQCQIVEDGGPTVQNQPKNKGPGPSGTSPESKRSILRGRR